MAKFCDFFWFEFPGSGVLSSVDPIVPTGAVYGAELEKLFEPIQTFSQLRVQLVVVQILENGSCGTESC